jgi:hypothetical protein
MMAAGRPPLVHLWADEDLWQRYREQVYDRGTLVVTRPDGAEKFCAVRGDVAPNVLVFDRTDRPAEAMDPSGRRLYQVHTVSTAGIGLARAMGAHRILLLGLDACRRGFEYYLDGRPHLNNDEVVERRGELVHERRHADWCGEHQLMRREFLKAGIYPGPWPGSGVYNLSPAGPWLDAWERVAPEDAFEWRGSADWSVRPKETVA